MSTTTRRTHEALDLLLDECDTLDIEVTVQGLGEDQVILRGPRGEPIEVSLRPGHAPMTEQVLRGLRFTFEELPLLVRGDSKEIRLLTPRIALARLLPSVYSFTHNRYGSVPGTEVVRARFSAAVFRTMAESPGARHLGTAYLGLLETPAGPLLAERRVDPCNLEVRVKRYHIGSPVHRYRFTEQHPTVAGPPLGRWSRFETPVVCFDWRHPLTDEEGVRLADEPISDDYAAVWMIDAGHGKRLAADAFGWLEDRFGSAGLRLIDICFFVDRSGTTLYGEISPDCMRVRSAASDDSRSLDKDQWRSGGRPEELLARYQELYRRVFPNHTATKEQEEER